MHVPEETTPPPQLGQVGLSTQHICSWLWLSLMPIHVRQPSKARAPVPEVVIVLVFISQAGQDGAQCPCHRAISLVVVDESCVVGRHAGVTVCSLQALWKSPTDLRTTQASREPSGAQPQARLALPLLRWACRTSPCAEWAGREGSASSSLSPSG